MSIDFARARENMVEQQIRPWNVLDTGILDLLGNNAPDPDWPLHRSFMRIIDFIAGMTDSYATEMAKAMTGHSTPI